MRKKLKELIRELKYYCIVFEIKGFYIKATFFYTNGNITKNFRTLESFNKYINK